MKSEYFLGRTVAGIKRTIGGDQVKRGDVRDMLGFRESGEITRGNGVRREVRKEHEEGK